MMTVLALEKGKKLVKDLPKGSFKAFLKGRKNILWLDIKNPVEGEFGLLSDVFDFHPLSIEDARKPQALPKIEEFRKYVLVVFHGISYNPRTGRIELKEIDVFMGRNFIVSVHSNSSNEIEEVMAGMEKKPYIMARGPDIILHRIIDYFIDKCFPLLAYFDREIEDLEDMIIAGRTGKTKAIIKKMMTLKRHILKVKQSIEPQRLVINRLTREETPFISERGSIYFRDVYDHIMRFYMELETYRDLVASTFEAYVSVVSNRMAEASNRMNEVMKTLTVIATIFMPLTFIVGLYGMNFRFMPELSWQYGYYAVLAAIAVIAAFMYIFFRRKGWA